ncbi:MAG: hypothetical protein ACHQUB_00715 [Candidatus Saccharimonadia bacterium]
MLKRLFAATLILGIIATPVLADSSLGPTPDAGNIGPTINTLQPANPSLQSADSTAGGISQPSTSTNLQPAGQSSAVPSLVSGTEADGAPVATPNSQTSTNHTGQILLGLIGVLILVCGFFLLRISSQLDSTNQGLPLASEPDVGDSLTADDVSTSVVEDMEQTDQPKNLETTEPNVAGASEMTQDDASSHKTVKKSRKSKRKKHK